MKKIIFEIIHANWSEIGPSDWAATNWLIYEDGSVARRDNFGFSDSDSSTKEHTFVLGTSLYREILRLVEIIKAKDIHVEALDGEAWGIKQFDGDNLMWSRNLDYIYGNKAFEQLASIMLQAN